MKNTFYLFILLVSFQSCKKDFYVIEALHVEEVFSIETDRNLSNRQGIYYDGKYLVWTRGENNAGEWLTAFDLNTGEVVWEIDFKGNLGRGGVMSIEGHYFYSNKKDLGMTVVDLKEKAIVFTYRDDTNNNFRTSTPTSYADGRLYKSIENRSSGLSTALEFDITNGESNPVFQWIAQPEKEVRLATPVAHRLDDKDKTSLFFLMQLKDRDSVDAEEQLYFVHGAKNNEYIWIDTLGVSSEWPRHLPIVHEDNVIVYAKGKLRSYHMESGMLKWETEVDEIDPFYTKLRVTGDDGYYFQYKSSLFLKFDPSTGEIIWNSDYAYIQTESKMVDHQGMLIFRSSYSQALSVVSKANGTKLNIRNPERRMLSSPIFYEEKQVLLCHELSTIYGVRLQEE